MSPWVSLRFLQTQTDARLVALARAGHERAFEALVVRYRRPLLAYCRRLLGADTRAEDALQQALLQAWSALRAGTEVSDLKAWLYRIAHNAAVTNLRRAANDPVELNEALHEVPADASDLDTYIAMRHALSCVAALPDTQRQVMLRTALDGQTHEQVARALGLSNVAVRGLVYRARATLRAAATAITPPPLIHWLLNTDGPGSLTQRLSELGAGGGSAGLASLLLKGGAVALSAGALVGGAAAIHTSVGRGNPAHTPPAGSSVVDRTKLAITDSSSRPAAAGQAGSSMVTSGQHLASATAHASTQTKPAGRPLGPQNPGSSGGDSGLGSSDTHGDAGAGGGGSHGGDSGSASVNSGRGDSGGGAGSSSDSRGGGTSGGGANDGSVSSASGGGGSDSHGGGSSEGSPNGSSNSGSDGSSSGSGGGGSDGSGGGSAASPLQTGIGVTPATR